MPGTQPMGLGLIVAVMRHAEMQDRSITAVFGEEPIARRARRGLDAALRFRTGPSEDSMGDARQRGEPPPDLLRFRRGFSPQPMIDGQGIDAAVPAVRPFGQQQGQR